MHAIPIKSNTPNYQTNLDVYSYKILCVGFYWFGTWSKNQSNMMLKEWKCLKCKFLSQVKVVNQEFVSFMSPPSVNLSPDKFDLLG